ncbi:hypothetical protein [Paenibacillus montanisoli]|uniref:Uncharacterized protein n=1 Tax=Paenibacillus montanisoli TaxID=2081970 RepID=A0A328TWM5_9BACL|nr:hypothetical protein [Paenibacillus montanisoli]RAP73953.1 hypothetical protein DL346_23020 [Paenibacillus montanisoli]
MKKQAFRLTVAVICIGAAVWVGTRWSSEAEDSVVPGSVNDPVVTKSYIDKKLAELGNQSGSGGQGVDEKKLQEMLDAFRSELEQSGGGSQQVVVVTVPVGKRLIAKDGAEFIVRAGKAMAYSADSNGISDLTDGKDIKNGKAVPNDHLILFPRGGRGVTAQVGQKSGLTVLVRGEYEIQVQP